ncbi:MAG: ZIP family zinc transporter [Actinomycetota bacterium]|nr:ZIP family zinc transporter [Actinomycetota bacterium]
MLGAAGWGALSAATLMVGAILAYAFKPSPRLTAIVMAIGSGLLIGSVSYDLVADAQISLQLPLLAASLFAGAAVFVLGTRLLEKRGAKNRKGLQPKTEAETNGNPLAIVLGSVLDGVPESFVLGLSVLNGGVSATLLAGIALSNLPEGMAASAGLRTRKWSLLKVLLMFAVVVATSAIAASLGYGLLTGDDGTLAGVVQTFAAGALLAMIADTMIPESYQVEREWTGGLVVAGFALSLLIAAALG